MFVPLAGVHAAMLWLLPWWPVVAVGLWWNAQTISHNFIHRPFFRHGWANRVFSAVLTLLLGFPQSLWRARHLAHHAGTAVRLRWQGQLLFEAVLVLALWGVLAAVATGYLLAVYVPGFVVGLGLCAVHGHYEHVRGAVSHRGRLCNLLFFNDGWHAEHHARPGAPWWELPRRREPAAAESRWPAVLRWLEGSPLDWLERWVLRSERLQAFVVRRHEHALTEVLDGQPAPRSVAIVGGGLFPRTALILERLLPNARLVVIDGRASHLDRVPTFVSMRRVELRLGWYDPTAHGEFDLVVIPLGYRGDRRRIYREVAGTTVLVHDWIWRRRGTGAVVSPLLLKRINRVERRSEMVASVVPTC